jgi:hypothetical protein
MAPMAGCSKEKPPEQQRTNNPPMPVVADAAVDKASPPPDAASAKATPRTPQTARLTRTGDDCYWQFPADCAPGEKCNPPAPRKADCPDIPVPDNGLAAQILADGSCRVFEDANCPKPEGDRPPPPCNPPPPRKVPCPE